MEKINIFRKGFNFSQDGPGNRLVYHLLGCNMHCPWCANPEGMKSDTENAYESLTTDEIYREIISSKRLFFDNGGVTFTGGEASLQLKSLIELFVMLKDDNINIAIESNATNPEIKNAFKYIDYVIFDFKHYDNFEHLKYTGLSNEVVKKNIELAIENNVDLLVRIPLINHVNASEEDINGFLSFFNTLDKKKFKVEFLKYHEYGKEKWQKLNRPYEVVDGFISEEIYQTFKARFSQQGIVVIDT